MTHVFDRSKTSLVARTLWRIETELANAPDLTALASSEGVSPFHLTRAFGLVTGQPVMAYIRARRLSEAARQLHGNKESVLSVALNVGYESHEGFARAFRDMFGCVPSAVRDTLPKNLQEPFIMISPNPIPTPVAKNVDFPGRRIAGRMRRHTMAERARIPVQWNEVAEEIGQHMNGSETYGVSYGFEGDAFNYLVGFADDGRTDTEELDHVRLDAGRYAVFEHDGHISSIGETWRAILDDWLPKSGKTLAEGPEFELYEADFDLSKPGGVSIWIPLA